jgi:hypothetical protein
MNIDFAMLLMKKYMPRSEYAAIESNLRKSEEREYFAQLIVDQASLIDQMPEVYNGDGNVYLHYFSGGSDWYIMEKDTEGLTTQAFGFACINGDVQFAELGYISIESLTRNGVELDLHWDVKTLDEVKKDLGL